MTLKQVKTLDRITALWALTEAGLGGVFHAFRMPFTGLIIAGVSVLFITMIGRLSNGNYRQILKATLIVLIVKMLISPHTPPTAYFAVFFQGISGFAIFYVFHINKISIHLFALVALLESGFQKLITLSIFYGASIWESINAFYTYIEDQLHVLSGLSGTQILIILYASLYISGAFIFSAITIRIIRDLEVDQHGLMKDYRQHTEKAKPRSSKKKKWIGRRTWLFIILLLIIAVLLLFNPDMGWQKALYVFFRAIFVIIIWYIAVAPLFKYLFERYLKRRKRQYGAELEFVLGFFPKLKSIALFVLRRNGKLNSFSKLKTFFNEVIYLALRVEIELNGENNNHNRHDQKRKNNRPEKLD